MQEVSASIEVRSGLQIYKSYGLSIILMLEDKNLYYQEKSGISYEIIHSALIEQALLVKNHGQRLLSCDPFVVNDLEHVFEKYQENKVNETLRYRAKIAFQKKDYAGAIKQYQLIGNACTPLDRKKMAVCEKLLGKV